MVKVQTKKIVATKKAIRPKSVVKGKQTGLTTFIALDSVTTPGKNITLPEASIKVSKYNKQFKVQQKILDEIDFASLKNPLPEKHQLTVLSFGGGQDSTTILHLLVEEPAFRKKYAPNDLLLIMSDTGNEHPSTYQHVDRMMRYAKKNNIEFTLLTPDKAYHSDKWQDLKSFYRRTNTVGSKGGFKKTCTDNLKLQPIYKYLEDYIHEKYDLDKKGGKRAFNEYAEKHGKILMMIGISKGEESRRIKYTEKFYQSKGLKISIEGLSKEKIKIKERDEKRKLSKNKWLLKEARPIKDPEGKFLIIPVNSDYPKDQPHEPKELTFDGKFPEPLWKKNSLTVQYPLIDMGIDRFAAQTYISSIGETIPLPSNCMICPYLSDSELVWLEKFYPEEYKDWVEIEANKIEKYKDDLEPKKNLGVSGAVKKDNKTGIWAAERLPQVLERAKKKTCDMTDEELFEYKMTHGHCVASQY